MSKGRLEAFSDGVIAILITIMVLELRAPEDASLAALLPLAPVLFSYALSFVFLGIYWNNHHHLLHLVKHVDAKVMWANMHLLFWLSLIPVATGWIGDHPYAAPPTALYAFVMFMSGIAYLLLQTAIVAHHGRDSALARELGGDFKGKVSGLSYLGAIGLAFVNHWLSVAIFVGIAILWFIPDSRLSRTAHGSESR